MASVVRIYKPRVNELEACRQDYRGAHARFKAAGEMYGGDSPEAASRLVELEHARDRMMAETRAG